jgi:hypothetical protein
MKINHALSSVLLIVCLSVNSQTNKKLSAPEKDFEKFWTSFKDNYAFFKLKGVNWDETYIKFRPSVTRKTKQSELVRLFSEMVAPLNDGHITISKGDEILYKVKKPSEFKAEFKGIEKELWKTSFRTLEANGFSPIKGIGPIVNEENLYYATRSNDIGFIRISRCFGILESIFDDQKEVADTKLMLQLFDSILASFSNTKGIIIDLRANGGGHAGVELASRLAIAKTITHYKATKIKGDYETITQLEPIFINPNTGIKYTNPVVILTNDKTASSAEDFAISLYKQENVTTIGSNTSGMLSDMFSTDLSHQLSFTLSNERYYSVEKKLLEDAGVPAEITILNTKKDIELQVDPVIKKAIETIQTKY